MAAGRDNEWCSQMASAVLAGQARLERVDLSALNWQGPSLETAAAAAAGRGARSAFHSGDCGGAALPPARRGSARRGATGRRTDGPGDVGRRDMANKHGVSATSESTRHPLFLVQEQPLT